MTIQTRLAVLLLPSLLLLYAVVASAELSIVAPGYRAETIATGPPVGLLDLVDGGDGFLYGIVEAGSGNVGGDDHALLRIDPTMGVWNSQGTIAFTMPDTSDLYRITCGPVGALTSKLYVVD
ncbi:MAG: hypothetical protein R3F35_21810 [Myxococcota bacterium]